MGSVTGHGRGDYGGPEPHFADKQSYPQSAPILAPITITM